MSGHPSGGQVVQHGTKIGKGLAALAGVTTQESVERLFTAVKCFPSIVFY